MNIITQIFDLLISLIETTFRFLFEFIELAVLQIPRKNKEYQAEFTSPGTLFSGRHTGFCLTGRRNLSIKHSYQNALITGGTGTGKSSVVLIPSLFSMKGSFIIHDPSGELFTKTAGYLTQKGYQIKVLHFSNPSVSSGYNPLTRAQSTSDIQKIASMLVTSALGKGSKDPFWNTQATALIAMLITILKKQEPEFQNLYNVRHLLNSMGGNPEAVDLLFSRFADNVLFAEYKSFIAYDSKVVSGVVATCKAALQIFSDESVAQVTSYDNLDLKEFRDKPVALFIQNSVADQKYYSVLTSLFFEQFFTHVMSCFPKDKEQDIFLLVDEASSLSLPTLPLAVANVRKHRAGIMLLVQDFNQLVHNYGKYEADAIKANCFAKMFFTGQSLETTRDLEQTLGKYQYENEKGITVVRPLMTSDEIRTMKISHALLICGHHQPIRVNLKPYYKRSNYTQYSKIPAPEFFNESLMDNIPVLTLPVTEPKGNE